MTEALLPYGRQSIDDADLKAVSEVLSGDYLTTGPAVGQFEDALAAYIGHGKAVAVNSGTAALHIACAALGLKAGDAAFVPALTFAATANAVLYCKATPVFVDVDPKTLCMSPESLKQAILLAKQSGLRPRVVLPVHYAGQPCALIEIQKIAEDYDLFVIQDACHAIGAGYQDQDGHWKNIGYTKANELVVFSFHPVKHVTTGEGGATITSNTQLATAMQALRSHGIVRHADDFTHKERAIDREGQVNSWYHEMQSLGWNYRLPDILAALGTSQLKKLPASVERRRAIAALYRQGLQSMPSVQVLAEQPYTRHSYHLFPLLIDFASLQTTRETFMRQLRDLGVGTQVHYLPVYYHPYYQQNRSQWLSVPCQIAERSYEQLLSIPMYPNLTDSDVAKVVAAVRQLTV